MSLEGCLQDRFFWGLDFDSPRGALQLLYTYLYIFTSSLIILPHGFVCPYLVDDDIKNSVR